MKPSSVLVSILMGVPWLLCLHNGLAAQQVKQTTPISKYTFAFRPIHLAGTLRKVIVEVHGLNVRKEYGHDLIGVLEITVLSVRNGRRKVMLRTRDEGDLHWFEASLYRHCKSGDYLLAIEANGGQHGHTRVYYINPRDFRPHLLTDDVGVIYGDPSGLPAGRLVEHSPDQYVADDEKSVGFKRRIANEAEYLARTLI